MTSDRHPSCHRGVLVNWLDATLKIITPLEPIIMPLITSNRDVKHGIKPLA